MYQQGGGLALLSFLELPGGLDPQLGLLGGARRALGQMSPGPMEQWV